MSESQEPLLSPPDDLPDDLDAQLARLLDDKRALAKQASARKSAMERLVKLWRTVDETPVALAKALDKAREVLGDELSAAVPDLDAMAQRAEQRLAVVRDQFGGELEEFFAEQGAELVRAGERIRSGPFEIVVDLRKGKASVSYGDDVVGKLVPLSAEKVFARVREAHRKVCERSFDPADFGGKLREAYLRVLRDENKNDGVRATVVRVYREFVLQAQGTNFRRDPLKKHLTEVPRPQFAWDLLRLEAANVPIDGRTFQLFETTLATSGSRSSGLLAVDLEGKRRELGGIAFK